MQSLHVFPMSAHNFSRCSNFLPHPKDVHVGWTSTYTLYQSKWFWVWLWVHPVMVGCPVQYRFPLCTLSSWDRLWPTRALNWKKQVKKELSHLFLLIFLKCLYSSHLLQCLVLEAFWILIKKFGDVFVTKNMPKELDSCLYQLTYGEIGFLIHHFD